jgi:anthranilate phosphoribosyltransferase
VEGSRPPEPYDLRPTTYDLQPLQMKKVLETLLSGVSLGEDEAAEAMGVIMDGGATPAQVGAFLTALRLRGETVAEIAGFARAMRARSLPVPTTRHATLVDTCGTGGDAIKTFNISTAAAFVVAGAGAGVAKHGNRSVTSKCGSADVLEALGARLDLSPEAVGAGIDAVGVGFLFARSHHPAMKYAAPVRAELGFRTVFNLLGPLTNPAGARRQVIGVYDPALCEPVADVLARLGAEHVLVVHGAGGLDEVSTWGETVVAERRGSLGEVYRLTPAKLGLPEASPEAVAAGETPEENATLLRAVLDGSDRGPRRDILLANAAAALYVAHLADDPARNGVARAAEIIDSGAAVAKLDAFIAYTREAGH